MLLTLNDKKLKDIKHKFALLVKNVDSGKFDVIEITDKLPLNILAIAKVQVLHKGLCRTHSFDKIKKIVRDMNAEQIKNICDKMGYKLYCDPSRTEKRAGKAEVIAAPKEYNLPMKEELVDESKFGIKMFRIDFVGYDGVEYTGFAKGESVKQVREEFWRNNTNVILKNIRVANEFVITKKHNSYRKDEDKGLSEGTIGKIEDAVRELKFFTEREYKIVTSKIENRYSVEENGVEIAAADDAKKLIVKMEGITAVYCMENEEETTRKSEERKERLMRELGLTEVSL